jgi:hypothetical protein
MKVQQAPTGPREYYERDERLRRVLDSFSLRPLLGESEPGIFKWLHHTLLDGRHLLSPR